MRRRGLTLAEILMATALVGFAMVTMVAVYLGGMRLMKQSRDRTVATELARNFLEATKSTKFSDFPAAARTFDGRSGDLPEPGTSFPAPPYPSLNQQGRDFFLVVTSTPRSDDLRSIKVEVVWDQTQSLSLQTYYRR